MLQGRKSTNRHLSPVSAVLLCFVAASLQLSACGGGSVVVSAGTGETNIGSPLPSAIRIPPVISLESFAYVLTTSPPLGIFRYDLEAGKAPYPFVTYSLFTKIAGIPDELLIVDEEHAFITTSGGSQDAGEGIHLFDPTPSSPGDFSLEETRRIVPITLDFPLPDSEGNLVSEMQPRYTAGVASSNGKLYVVTSNFTAVGGNPVCPPGTVLIYGWDPDSAPPTIDPSSPSVLVTTRFNPTEVTALGGRFVLVTNSGVIAIRNAQAVPLTDGSVDVVDTGLDCIVATYPLGMGAPSYKPIAITPDGSRALLGSVAYNSVYELDLTVLYDLPESCPDPVPRLDDYVLAGPDNPIVVGSSRERVNDFIVQVGLNRNGTRAYATGSNSGTLSILEVETREGVPSPKTPPLQVLALTPPLDPQIAPLEEVMPGPLAVRPGRPGVDYEGPDLFVLTGQPTGKMLSIQTY